MPSSVSILTSTHGKLPATTAVLTRVIRMIPPCRLSAIGYRLSGSQGGGTSSTDLPSCRLRLRADSASSDGRRLTSGAHPEWYPGVLEQLLRLRVEEMKVILV